MRRRTTARPRALWTLALIVSIAIGLGELTAARTESGPGSTEPGSRAAAETAATEPEATGPGVEAAAAVAIEPVSPAGPLVEPGARSTPPEAVQLRVGLATDLPRVELPCCAPHVVLRLSDGALRLDRQTTVEPAPSVGGASVFRLQVAALKDETQARGLAERLGRSTGLPADAVFDAGTDLYRVRVGRFALREAADAARGALEVQGVASAFLVSEGRGLQDPGFVVRRGERSARVDGRWLEIEATRAGAGIAFEDDRYRGRLLVFLNDRGALNVINELPLEEYLRGVVPKEMGPELYNELEALKAQTVAARTYTVRNLDQFADEGYDICSTPRCQVYGGMAVEHPLSDRAISETAGQVVLFGGGPAETFYSATSGGHTENVEVVFPLKTGAYLRGVPSIEGGVTTLGRASPGLATFPGGLVERLLPASGGPPERALSARLEHLALEAGLSVPRDQLGSLRRDEVFRYVASIFDLALDRRLLEPAAASPRRLGDPPDGWGDRELAFASWLQSSDLARADDRPLGPREVDELLFRLALYLGVLDSIEGHFLQAVSGTLRLRDRDRHLEMPLADDALTYRRRGEALRPGPLDLMAGDRLDVYRRGDEILALVQPVDARPVTLGDKHAPRSRWRRWRSDRELRALVEQRYPGFPFAGFEVLERGVSGRVGRLALLGTGGERLEIEGLAIRWTFDLPDTLFWAERASGRGGVPGWSFRGRGWGHGVGMSQAGAFGMARRGASYRDILQHYYTGVELGVLKPLRPRPRPHAG